MLVRLRWLLAGMGMGVGGSWWAKRTARRAAASLRPAQVGTRVAREARRRVGAARLDARSARRETEGRLRHRAAHATVDRRSAGPDSAAPPAVAGSGSDPAAVPGAGLGPARAPTPTTAG